MHVRRTVRVCTSPRTCMHMGQVYVFFFPGDIPPFFALYQGIFSGCPCEFSRFYSRFPKIVLRILSSSPVAYEKSIAGAKRDGDIPL